LKNFLFLYCSGKALVYDSEEEEDGPSDNNLTVDKKKVLKFFGEGTEQELTGIQVPYLLLHSSLVFSYCYIVHWYSGCYIDYWFSGTAT